MRPSLTSLKVLSSLGLLVSCLGLSATGCDLASSLVDVGGALGNQDAALLDSPGRKIASGKFRSLLVDGSLEDGGHVLALRETDDGRELAIIPYLDGSPCYVSPAVAHDRLSSRIDVELPGIVAVQRTADERGRGEINFVDFRCKEAIAPLQSSSIPQVIFPTTAPQGILTLAEDTELYLVSPAEGELKLVAKDVTQARAQGDVLWSIEGGKLVRRDAEFAILDSVGEGVTEFVIPGGTKIGAAFMDSRGLHTWNSEEGATLLSETGCAPSALGTDGIVYLDPCEERKLALFTTGARLGLTDDTVKIVGPKNVVEHTLVQSYFGQGASTTEILFLTSDAPGTTGALMVGTIEAGADAMDGVFTLSTTELSPAPAALRLGSIYTKFDGKSGDLVELQREEGEVTGLRTIARGVAQLPGGSAYSVRGALTNFDGLTGDLQILPQEEGAEPYTLATQVPVQLQTIELETAQVAFIADSKNGFLGTLYLTEGPGNPFKKPQKIAENVHLDTARFLEQPYGLSYLKRSPGEEFSSLEVYLLDSGLTLKVHDKVSEYRTVPWPAPGILYAVPEGKDQGLWFSKAR